MDFFLIFGAFILGGFLVFLWFSRIISVYKNEKQTIESNFELWKREATDKLMHQENAYKNLQISKENLLQENARLTETTKNLKEQLLHQKEDLTKLQDKFSLQFENLAQQILDKNAAKFTAMNKDNIDQVLQPLREKISLFEKKVGETHENFIKGHAELGMQLKQLHDNNIKIADEAKSLTEALRGSSKTQGNWGELVLERVLEKSGLTKGMEYEVQQRMKNEEGKVQLPDVIVYLPNEKKMIIDSKVSLRAYESYVNAENETDKSNFLKAHIAAVQKHVKDLSEKKYEDLHGNETPDFVLLFIPIEPALYLAQNHDPHFFYTAFQQNILLVSPTTLLATLRTVDMIWNNEKQQQNAQEIAKHASNLYDKFASLLEELQLLGNRISSTQSKYEDAMKKLTGKQNLVKDIQHLKTLGVSSKKEIQS